MSLLKAYIERGDQESWLHAKIALGTLLNNGKELMSAVNVVVDKLGPDTYPGSKEDIGKLYQGLARIRAAVSVTANLPEKPEAETMTMAKSVFSLISALPTVANSAVGQLEAAGEDRRKVSGVSTHAVLSWGASSPARARQGHVRVLCGCSSRGREAGRFHSIRLPPSLGSFARFG